MSAYAIIRVELPEVEDIDSDGFIEALTIDLKQGLQGYDWSIEEVFGVSNVAS